MKPNTQMLNGQPQPTPQYMSSQMPFGQYLILFFMSPVLALGQALTRLGDVHAKNVLWLFCAFYGAAFCLERDTGVDAAMYVKWLKEMHGDDLSLNTLFGMFYREGQRYYDLFEPLLSFIVSRFTTNSQVFLACVGLTFGFFYSRVVFYFIDRVRSDFTLLSFYLLIVIAFSLDIGTGINGVRMYTAMFAFLYGAIPYFQDRKQKHLLWAASSVLFHFSFAIPVALLCVERLLGSLKLPIFIAFLFSFAVAEIDIGFFRSFMNILPFSMENRVGGYLSGSKTAVQEYAQIIGVNRYLMKIFIIITMCYTYYAFLSRKGYSLSGMPVFVMLMYTFTNLSGTVGSIHRFYVLGDIIAIGYLLLMLGRYRFLKKEFKPILAVSSLLLLLQLALGVRFFLGFASNALIVGNPVIVWFLPVNRSLYSYMPKLW